MMDVIRGVGLDKRWSPIVNGERIEPGILAYLIPGCGFGGSCFPKDVAAIRTQGKKLGLDMKLTDAILSVNDLQPKQVVNILKNHMDISGKKILLLGLAFKENTDDVRESASIKIVEELLKAQSVIYAHDPIAVPNFQKMVSSNDNLHYVTNWTEYIELVDIVILATRWSNYLSLSSCNMQEKVFFDARRMFKKDKIVAKKVLCIG
jgi:UDPglucose 6-dehydrogenase/GDP-mannose 6-dehydrogenase